jgi:hypothetical protein
MLWTGENAIINSELESAMLLHAHSAVVRQRAIKEQIPSIQVCSVNYNSGNIF